VQWCAGSATVVAEGVALADLLGEAVGCFLGVPPGRNTASKEAMSAAPRTALRAMTPRLRCWRRLAIRISCWRRYFSLAILRWRSFFPATGRVLLSLSHYLATAGIHGRQASEPGVYL
jgi:hypothetical protein